MTEFLSSFGVAGLLCLPCLILGGVVGLTLVAGTLSAVVASPIFQAGGVLLLVAAGIVAWRAYGSVACDTCVPVTSRPQPGAQLDQAP